MADPDRRACAKCQRLFAAKMAMCPFCGHRAAGPAPAASPASASSAATPSSAASRPGSAQPLAVPDFGAVAAELIPVLRLSGVVPNFTAASLAGLDAVLDGLWPGAGGARDAADGARAAPLVRQVACYAGEVVRRAWGGRWVADPGTPDQGRVVLADGQTVDPFSFAELRWSLGRSHDLFTQLEVTRALIAAHRPGGLPADPAEASHWSEQGDSFQLMGRPDLALRFYERVIQLAPHSGAGWYGTGNCHAFQGRFAEAVPCYDRAVELTPAFPEAWENRALALVELGRLDEADKCLDRVLALAPGKASALCTRGNLQRRRGQAAEALQSYAAAVRADPASRPAWIEQAALLEEHGRRDEAVASLDRALALDPADAPAWLARARSLVGLARDEEALRSCDEAVRHDPRSAAGWSEKARLETALGRKAAAATSLRALVALEAADAATVVEARQRLALLDADPERWAGEAEAHARAGRIAEAVAAFDRVVAADPARTVAWRERGVGLALLERFDEALASFDRAIALAPDDVKAWDYKAVALTRIDRSDQALVALDRALALAPGRAGLLKHRGACLENLGRQEEALAAYEAALAADAPAVVDAWLLKAGVERRLGRSAEALASFRRFVADAPPERAAQVEAARREVATLERDLGSGQAVAAAPAPPPSRVVPDAQAWYEKALAHARAGRFAEALPGLETATELDPVNRTFWKDRGLCLSELGRDEEAVPCFARSIELAPLHAEPHYSKARAHERLGQQVDAGRHYQMFLVLDYPVHAEWAAHARQRLGEWGLPELDLQELGLFDGFMGVHLELARQVGAREDDPALWVGLARTFIGADRPDVAFHCLERALALDPRAVEAWFYTGTLLSDRDRFEEALGRLDRAVALDPQHVDAWWYKVTVEERLGRRAEMAASLRRYLAVAPPEHPHHRERIDKARALLAKLGP